MSFCLSVPSLDQCCLYQRVDGVRRPPGSVPDQALGIHVARATLQLRQAACTTRPPTGFLAASSRLALGEILDAYVGAAPGTGRGYGVASAQLRMISIRPTQTSTIFAGCSLCFPEDWQKGVLAITAYNLL